MDSQLTILKNLSEALIMVNEEGVIEFANDAITDVLGYKPKNLIGRPMSILMPEKTIHGHQRKFDSFLQNPKRRKMGNTDPIRIKHQNGSVINVEISLSSVEIEGARKAIALIVDINRFFKYKNPLKDKLELYYSLIEHNTDHLFQIDREYKIQYVNHVSPGLTKEEVMGAYLIDLLPNDYTKDLVKNILTSVFETGIAKSYKVDFPSPLGALHYDTTVTPVIKNGEIFRLNLITRNVTNDYNIKKQLIERKNFIEKIDLNSINGIYIYNFQTATTEYTNSKYTEIFGYSREEINKMTTDDFISLFHVSDRENVIEHLKKVRHSKEGQFFTLEYRIKSKKGDWVWCLSRDSGFEYNEEGKATSFIGAFVDITQTKKIELELLQKNKEIENFVYHACHDIKSPINSISQLIDLSLEDSKNKEELEIVDKSIKRLRNLVVSLLDFGNESIFKKTEYVALDDLVDNVLDDLKTDIDASSSRIERKNELPEINCYKLGMYQVFLNLISNAIKFRNRITTPVITIKAQSQVQHWKFTVTDNGIGIKNDKKDAIFDAFTRLHSEYDGNGLGLANCKKVISRHGGDIWVENNKEGGSTFIFTISKDLDKLSDQLEIKNTQAEEHTL
ncbi:PAS domain-containing sensor histidine kinase [Flammeovirga aprica]|uniref:histidine kinase n=1 Tax=Flammeovirga aprica JL-4 TaxID=694437 RepID=A0A7X9RVS1_9BACT|nr:PAS domain S-box protein [Flammeovirga aprica]NME69607.1 PAS domain S-box protein [Flammeovirga aprica JL-4]